MSISIANTSVPHARGGSSNPTLRGWGVRSGVSRSEATANGAEHAPPPRRLLWLLLGLWGRRKMGMTPNLVKVSCASRTHVTWRGKSAFTRELEKRGIKQVVAKPRRPQTLGKIERFWGSLWRECIESAVFIDLGDAQKRIGLFIDHYNFQRPHQGIEGSTPADRFFGAAEEVKRTLQARVSANALELAKNGVPKPPFYLTGQVGGKPFSVHAEGERVILTRSEGERQEIDLVPPPPEPEVAKAELPTPVCPMGEVIGLGTEDAHAEPPVAALVACRAHRGPRCFERARPRHQRGYPARLLPVAATRRAGRSPETLSPCLAKTSSACASFLALATRRRRLGHGLQRSAATDRRRLSLPFCCARSGEPSATPVAADVRHEGRDRHRCALAALPHTRCPAGPESR